MSDIHKTIERAKQELEQMIDLNPQIMLLLDREGVIQRSNAALLRLMKFDDFKNVLGKSFAEVFPGAEERINIEDLKGGMTIECDVEMPGIGLRNLEFTVISGGGRAELSVLIVDDVTLQNRLAADMEQKHKTEAVSALAGALMHNINQSLTVMMVQSHMVQIALEKKGLLSDDINECLEDVVNHTNKVASILERASEPSQFVTEDYVGGVKILDIEGSAKAPTPISEIDAEMKKVVEAGSSVLPGLVTILAALDLHEPGAFLHAQHVAAVSALLAKEMGSSREDIARLRTCARFHDIGKIQIPDSILQKPTSLSADEWRVIKTHSERGKEILARFPEMAEAAEVAYTHHERYDGAGYPNGLLGDDIPVFAAITAAADAFDVQRTGRLYEPVVPLEECMDEMDSCSGTQFHPDVIAALHRISVEADRLVSAAS